MEIRHNGPKSVYRKGWVDFRFPSLSRYLCNNYGAEGWGYARQVGRSRVRFPLETTGFLHCHNPFGRTVALGSTQSPAEMSTRFISWVFKGGRCVGLTTLPPSCADCLEIMGASDSWIHKSLSRPVMGLTYLLLYLCFCSHQRDDCTRGALFFF